MTDELKPCPFCGEKAIRCENFTGLAMFWTQCGSCHACPGGDHATREKADAAWNTRAAHYEGRRAVVGGDWVLVPREPTERMLHHGDKAQYGTSDGFLGRDIYRAMLAAAPSPPVAGETDDAAALISEAARLIAPADGEAVFYIRVGGEYTHMRVQTKGDVSPEAALANAIKALEGEKGALSNCPIHRAGTAASATPPTGDGKPYRYKAIEYAVRLADSKMGTVRKALALQKGEADG